MPLNELSLAQLSELADSLKSLAAVGEVLAPLHPVFDLSPGQPTRITLDPVMPVDIVVEPPPFLQPSTEPAPFWAAAAPEPLDAPSTAGEGVEGATHSAKARSRSGDDDDPPRVAASPEAEAESGGGRSWQRHTPPAAPSRMNLKALPWTQAEDDTLVAAVVENMTRHGMARHTATAAAARSLPGRTDDAAVYRGRTKLRDRIDAALSAAALRQAQTETPEIPGAEADQGDAAAVGQAPAAVQPVEMPSAEEVAASFERPMPDDPADLHGDDLALWRFLQCHRPKWPMTTGTDLDLIVGLGRGDKLPALSADLGIDTEALKQRYRTLTSRILDTRGNVSIEGGPRLIKLLRRIAKSPAEAA